MAVARMQSWHPGRTATASSGSRLSIQEPYVDAGRAASYLSMSRKTLLRKARTGRLPAHPIGDGCKKMWRFRISELDHWMQTGVTSGSDEGVQRKGRLFDETATILIRYVVPRTTQERA